METQKLTSEIEDIVKSSNKKESDIIAKALNIGIKKLWIESVLDNYLSGKISKKKAVQLVGSNLVNLAEKQKKAIIEDIKWGFNA